MTKEQLEGLGVAVFPNGDNPRWANRHGIPDQPTIPEKPIRAETPEDVRRVIDQAEGAAVTNINNLIESRKIENELAGIRKELHTMNEILKRWKEKARY